MKMNKIKLKDIANINMGQSPKSENYSFNEGTPFLQGNRTFGRKYPKIDTYTKKITKLAKKGEVLISVRAPVGDLNIAPVDLCIGRGLSSLNSFNDLNQFLYYCLKYNMKTILKQGSGTTYESINKDILENLELIAPIEKYYKKVEEILFKLDEKIELNDKINSELENMAKTIYDYWFLQFEFPNEEGKPYKSSGGKMVWNEELKKEIPDGFKIEKIENFCRIFTGKKDVNQALEKGKYKFFSCSPNYKYSNEKIYEGKAILISGNGSYTGRTILVNDAIDLYQRTYACVLKNNLNCIEYFYYTLLKFFVPIVSGGTHGSTIPYIIYDDIAKQKIIINENIIGKFKKIISPIQNKIFQLKNENEELTSLRDYLLPLLMNGQIGFKN
jgi:type I restriction enzyme S subunit